jgi:hypothetical protein
VLKPEVLVETKELKWLQLMMVHTQTIVDLEIKTLFKQISARLITHLNSRFLNRDLPGKIWSTSTFETVTKNQGETFLIHDCGAYCLLNNVKPCMAFNVESDVCNLMDFTLAGPETSTVTSTVALNQGEQC